MITRQHISMLRPLLPAIVLLAAGIIMISSDGLPFSDYLIRNRHEAIAAAAMHIRAVESTNAEAERTLAPLIGIYESAMKTDGESAAGIFRERVLNSVQRSGLKSRTVGAVRTVEITENIFLYDLIFTADGTTAEAAAFLNELEMGLPRLYWRSITIRPNSQLAPSYVTVSGTITGFDFAGPGLVLPEASGSGSGGGGGND